MQYQVGGTDLDIEGGALRGGHARPTERPQVEQMEQVEQGDQVKMISPPAARS